MFLLPSLIVGIVVAILLGGRPTRLREVEFRHGWTVFAALALQVVLFTRVGDPIPADIAATVHLASYALLFAFAAANLKNAALIPILLGMAANAAAIVANGGRMPVSEDAWRAAEQRAADGSNVVVGGDRLAFLGDVFALPAGIPLANVFSVGDLLIAVGTVMFIVNASLEGPRRKMLSPRRLVQPLAVGSYRRLVAGKLVSQLGDWLTLSALVGWLYAEEGSMGHVAVLLLVRLVPPLFGGGVAAAVADRLPKQHLLMSAELIRGAAIAVAAFSVVIESLPLAFAAVAVNGALSAVSSTAVSALVPSLVDAERLPAANAGRGIAEDAAMALGAVGGGATLVVSDVETALVVGVTTFAIAAFMYSRIRVPPASATEEAADSPGPGDAGLRAGVRHLVSRPRLIIVLAAFSAATFATGLTNATLPRFTTEQLGLGEGAYGFGIAAIAFGLTIGQATVGLTRVGRDSGRWIGAGLLLMGAVFAALAFTVHAPTAILFLAVIGFLDGITDVLFETTVQREADPRFYGRIFGLASAAMTTTMMGAVAAAPLLNHVADSRNAILLAGLVVAAAASIALVGSHRNGARARRTRDVMAVSIVAERIATAERRDLC